MEDPHKFISTGKEQNFINKALSNQYSKNMVHEGTNFNSHVFWFNLN